MAKVGVSQTLVQIGVDRTQTDKETALPKQGRFLSNDRA